jgi:hypothetical protein
MTTTAREALLQNIVEYVANEQKTGDRRRDYRRARLARHARGVATLQRGDGNYAKYAGALPIATADGRIIVGRVVNGLSPGR